MRAETARAVDSIWYGESAWRWPLWPLSLLFRLVVTLRAAAYASGVKRSVRLPVPVVVVGNVTAGGTGKTPLVIWLAETLRARGWSPGIVTRGYRGRARSWPRHVAADDDPALVGDEAVLLAARTGVPVSAGPDRVAAGALLADGGVDVVISDDGLQHRRMARAFEIAVVDGRRGLGNGLCLPAGPLREPASRLGTVDAVVVNDGGTASSASGSGTSACAGVPSSALRMTLRVSRVYRVRDGATARLADFAGRTVHAVAGIGDPERFFRMLERAGLDVCRHPLPDHAEITAADLRPAPHGAVLVTEKDAVKCREIAHDDLWCVAVEAVLEAEAGGRLARTIDERLRASGGRPAVRA
ncbi:MAG TPA: tetraacyldisaccharide 4'-kinase [Gammaproteobacteria bacterium]